MKKLFFLLFLVPMIQTYAQERDTCYAGVYVTKDDFVNHQLSDKIDLGAPGNKFTFPPPADWILTIKITTPEHTRVFREGEVFGYYKCGRVYRYSRGGELYAPEDFYRVEDDRYLVIYTAVFNGGAEYYYSVHPTSQIHRLNIKNLKRDFKDYPAFIKQVRDMKRKDLYGDLAKRDDRGRYIINEIYAENFK